MLARKEHWTNRGFYNVNECRIDVRRATIRNHCKGKIKIANAIIPPYKKLNTYDSLHLKMRPRCNRKTEAWQRVIKCEKNSGNKTFLIIL